MNAAPVIVIGEALIDLLPAPRLGGAPFNVARALGRLGQPVTYVGRISTDRHGDSLAEALLADGVTLPPGLRDARPTPLAFAEFGDDGQATYRFELAGSAAEALTGDDALAAVPAGHASAIYAGGLGLVLEPLAAATESLLSADRGDTLVFVDPNVRPAAIPDMAVYRSRLDRVLAQADVVKVSDADLAILAPGVEAEAAARALFERGPKLVLLTQGAQGAVALGAFGRLAVPAPPVAVVDTVGAGDAFSGAWIARWLETGASLAEPDQVLEATRFAVKAAAFCCTRAGAVAPTLRELTDEDAATSARPDPSAAPEAPSADLRRWIDAARSLRALMRSDPHRPTYHFVAPEGAAMPFDPNGAIYWKGKYHLGFIYQKRAASRGALGSDWLNNGHVWGHAVSTDLLHWTQYPDMLDVRPGDPEVAIFSGGAFLSREGVPHLIYHGPGANSNLLAYAADDDLKVWTKIATPALEPLDPADNVKAVAGKYSTFDPCAWFDRKADAYYQISGGQKPALFKSKDLQDWRYLGDLIDTANLMRHRDEDLACPAFFSLGEKCVLLFISHQLGAQYYVGTFAEDRFTPERHGRMNWPGGTFFAPEHLQDDKGRTIIWGWVVERKPAHLPDYAWSGIMSLPRVLSLGDDGELRLAPPEELRSIRLEETRDDDFELAPHSERSLQAHGRSIEIELELFGARTSPAGVKVFASPEGREETVVAYDPVSQELVVDFARSSAAGPVVHPSHVFSTAVRGYPAAVSQQRAPLVLATGEPLKLDIFLDRSVLEVFANGIQCVTQVVYPELVASTGVRVFSGADAISVRNARSWTMAETNFC